MRSTQTSPKLSRRRTRILRRLLRPSDPTRVLTPTPAAEQEQHTIAQVAAKPGQPLRIRTAFAKHVLKQTLQGRLRVRAVRTRLP